MLRLGKKRTVFLSGWKWGVKGARGALEAA